VITLLATLIGYFILRALFVLPIEKLIKKVRQTDTHDTIVFDDKSEIGMLVESLNTRTHHLIEALKRESEEYQLRMAQEEMLIQQSKMAMMGEMMDSVAHQWKQPLNALTLYSELIRNDFHEGNVDKNYIEKFRSDIQLQIDHMVNTLDEFRSFFRPSKEQNDFRLVDVVHSALFLAKDDILKNHILVKVEQEDEIIINGYENEFKHLILNIINNAKDAFIEKDIQQRLVRIRLIASSEGDRMEICDNAGGVPEEVIETIFDANVTTKEEGKGTGIGLYMSRQIASKHNAVLSVENREEGACFIVTFSS
jgi:signal transduction histidine kinase